MKSPVRTVWRVSMTIALILTVGIGLQRRFIREIQNRLVRRLGVLATGAGAGDGGPTAPSG